MRLLTRKIYRAFPELDQFDDEVCRKYIARAEASRGHFLRIFLILVSIFIGLLAAALIAAPLHQILNYLARVVQGKRVSDMTDTTLRFIVAMNYIWMPWISGLLMRDKLLARVIRRQLRSVECPECQYNLIGLTVIGESENKKVRCPECGHVICLADHNITEADIDPTLAQESV